MNDELRREHTTTKDEARDHTAEQIRKVISPDLYRTGTVFGRYAVRIRKIEMIEKSATTIRSRSERSFALICTTPGRFRATRGTYHHD